MQWLTCTEFNIFETTFKNLAISHPYLNWGLLGNNLAGLVGPLDGTWALQLSIAHHPG